MCLTTVAVPHPSMPEGNPERQQSVKMVEKLQGFPNHAMYSREGKTWAIWKRGQPALRCQRAPTLGPAVMVASNPKRLKPISPRSPGPHAPYHNQQTQQTDALRMLQRFYRYVWGCGFRVLSRPIGGEKFRRGRVHLALHEGNPLQRKG